MLADEQLEEVLGENRATLVDALGRGHREGILPTARGFFDHFTRFFEEHNILQRPEDFPGRRQTKDPA